MPEPGSNHETTHETLDSDVAVGSGRLSEDAPVIGFVIVWSSDEPSHVGGWLPVAGRGSGARLLGRGRARAEDTCPRLLLLQQRPGQNASLPPLQSQALSRTQLLVRPLAADALEVENLGRRTLLLNGVPGERHQLRPGHVLEIGSQLALLCTLRPVRLAGVTPSPGHPFGHADAHGMVGESPAAWRLRLDLEFAGSRTGHVLITGTTGTGKELAARALHRQSGRSGAFVSRNAATLPESLVDAELYGNPKGYPNPGMPEREGLIGAAHRGSLFLDEFAELPAGTQTHLLRVLDSGEYQRLGESTARKSDFRLIAATNRSHDSLRTDLLARFDFRVRLPDLAQRREDIPLLLLHLFREITSSDAILGDRFSLSNGLPRLAPGFLHEVVRHPLSGNVRELRRLIWRSLGESPGDALVWPEQREPDAREPHEELPHAEIQRALDANNGSIEKTWRALGLSSRYALRRLIKKYGVSITRRGGN